MQIINIFYKNEFANSVARTFALSVFGKMLTPLSFSEGMLVNGATEMLSVGIERRMVFSRKKEVRILIRIGAAIAFLATLHFSAFLYPPIRKTFIGTICAKLIPRHIFVLFLQAIKINVFLINKEEKDIYGCI